MRFAKATRIPGWHLCWLSTTNSYDTIDKRIRLGYVPVKADELPGFDNYRVKAGEHVGQISLVTRCCCSRFPMEQSIKKSCNRLHYDLPNDESDAKIRVQVENLQEQRDSSTGRPLCGWKAKVLAIRYEQPTKLTPRYFRGLTGLRSKLCLQPNAPFGLRPAFHPSGLDRAQALANGIKQYLDSGLRVRWLSATSSRVNRSNYDPDRRRTLNRAAQVAEAFVGAFDGVEWTDTTGRRRVSNYWPALTAYQTGSCVAYFYNDPQHRVRNSGCWFAVAQAAVGDEFDFVNRITAGSTTTGLSQCDTLKYLRFGGRG